MNATKHAVTEALGSPIKNGPTYPKPKTKAPKPKQGFGPLMIKQPAMGRWKCDSCATVGNGLESLKHHHKAKGHTSVTALEWTGIA